MPYVPVGEDLPGIIGLLAYRPDTGAVLGELAELLLRAESSLSRGERELIAARVSTLNGCAFCASSHAAFAAAQLPGGAEFVERARVDPSAAPVPPKLHCLLDIAAAVGRSGREVTPDLVERARGEGATDREIHDTVLIAAAFSMYNRYVDGLATLVPSDPAFYARHAETLAVHGYAALRD